MGIARNVRAALTFGLVNTTKHNDAKKNYGIRLAQHERTVGIYNNNLEQVRLSEETMSHHFGRAVEKLLAHGALQTDKDNNLDYGWYRPQEQVDEVEDNPDFQRAGPGAAAAFGLGIGTPAAVWTLVSIYGTAATGTAIGSLSGAAAGAATAAWIGRAVTLGAGGMTIGRFALGPIGVAGSLAATPLGYLIAQNRERNYIRKTTEAIHKMDKYEGILKQSETQFRSLQLRMTTNTAELQRLTRQLETASPNTDDVQKTVADLDATMRTTKTIWDELGETFRRRDKQWDDMNKETDAS